MPRPSVWLSTALIESLPSFNEWIENPVPETGVSLNDEVIAMTTSNDRICDYCNRRPATIVAGAHRVCSQCSFVCENCQTATSNFESEGRTADGRQLCSRCMTYCPACGNRVSVFGPDFHMCSLRDGDTDCDCGDCGGGHSGMAPYHHTQPFLWLGGEKAKYHIGFELEISARDNDPVFPVTQWALDHLGSQFIFDPKSDSSVRGFEIASQPMTPEYFESVDWDSFFDMLNQNYPVSSEPDSHGLHVHVGRGAFNGDLVSMAAYAHLMQTGDHLERIARRSPTHYCVKMNKPVSEVLVSDRNRTYRAYSRQQIRLMDDGVEVSRGAVNLQPRATVEIRAFRSTRSAKEFRNAVRVSYLAADYIASIRSKDRVNKSKLNWVTSRWVAVAKPDAFASIAGLDF